MNGTSTLKKVPMITIFIFFILSAVLSQPGLAGYKEVGDLFPDTEVTGTMDVYPDSRVIRSRFVTVDFKQLFPEPEPGQDENCPAGLLHLNLFPGSFFIARLDHMVKHPSGSISWIGWTREEESNSVILTIKDNIIWGNISTGGETYHIRHTGNGVHEIQQTDHAKYPEPMEPIPVYSEERIRDIPTGDDGSVIDIMVVYTGDVRTAVGGTTAVETLIDQAVAETNTGYANSGINHRVQLVHAAEVIYDETDFQWGPTLYRLKTPDDGYMDNVHTLRDNYYADEVIMLVNGAGHCGLAYFMDNVSPNFESSAFSLVHWTCATGYYSFAHEMGHNMGARHDRYVDNRDNGPFNYNHGYVYTPNRWRTIMAYNKECSDDGFDCTRLNYWSNPEILYQGVPMGVPGGEGAGADNRRTLNNTAYIVANFRAGNSPPEFNTIYGTVNGREGTALSLDLSAADPDPGDTVTYNISNSPPGASFDNSTGAFTWTPAYTHAGTYVVTFTASDGRLTTTQDVTVNVINVKKIKK
jgi:hypothetical protein